jgi:flagellar assembly protein FliH
LSNVVKIRAGTTGVRVRRTAQSGHDLPALAPPDSGRLQEKPQPAVLPRNSVDVAGEYERGFADGIADAEARLAAGYNERLAGHTARIESLLTTMQGQLWHLYERIERDAFRFALAVAGKIIKREVRVDDGTAVRQIQDALRRVVGVDAIKLRVNPTDEQVIREHRPAILASAESVREFIVEPDESIEAGSCIVECASGNVDARWATQLRQVEAALFGRISGILGEQE